MRTEEPFAGPRFARDTERRTGCRMCGDEDLASAGNVKGFPFVACPTCHFVFTPEVTQDGTDELYEAGYHGVTEGAPDEGWSRAEAEFLAPAFTRLPDGPLRILDFGTGQSNTPDGLRARGHRVIAVDVVPPLRAHPDRLTGSILDLDLPLKGFDLTYAYQVMEHLPEPRPILERLLALTRPGGLVLVHTDMEMPEREGGLDAWWYVTPPDHCAFYRHRTFDVFLAGTPHAVAWRDPRTVVIRVGDA